VKIPLLDLSAQNGPLEKEISAAIQEVVASQHFIMGEPVAQFEKEIAAYIGVPHAISCASGSDALLLALMALDLKPDEGVITVPFTFFATVSAITRLQGTPFFVDIDAPTFNMDPHALANFLKDHCELRSDGTYHRKKGIRIRAVIPVYLFGQCAAMDEIGKLAKEWKLAVIEDAAQALSARFNNKPAGHWGDIACYSFFPSKNLGAMGDGGLMTTHDAGLAERLRVLRLHGSKPKYYHKWIGINSRLDTMQAAILRVKLKHLDGWSKGRARNAALYDAALARLKPSVVTPTIAPKQTSVFNQYSIRSQRRDTLRQHLSDAGIGTEVYYPLPLHLQECFAYLGYQKGDFPESEKAAAEALALPIYPELTEEQLSYVIKNIEQFEGISTSRV